MIKYLLTLLLLVFLTYPALADEINSNYLTINEGQIHYLSAGEKTNKELVVFLHGFPEYSGVWKPYLKAFKDKYYVVAPDLPGYGQSVILPNVEDYKAPKLASYIEQFIHKLGYKDAYIVGHDWGGSVAWLMGINYPKTVKKLVIFNSPHPLIFNQLYTAQPRTEQYYLFWYYRSFKAQAITANVFRAKDFDILKLFAFDQREMTPEEIEGYVQQWERPGALEAQLNYYQALDFVELPDWFKGLFYPSIVNSFKVNVPTLVLWGEKDGALSLENLNGLYKVVTDLQVKRFPAIGHWSYSDSSQEMIPYLKTFFESQ